GRDDELRAHGLAVAQRGDGGVAPHVDRIDRRARHDADALRAREPLEERVADQHVLDDMTEVGLADLRAVELDRAEPVRRVAFPYAHALVRARAPRGDRRPRARTLQRALA